MLRWILLLIGTALFLIAIWPFPVAGEGILPSPDATLTIGGISTVGQTFTPDHIPLVGVQIWLGGSAEVEPPLPVTLRVRYAHAAPVDLIDVTQPLSSVSPDGLLTFHFSPLYAPHDPFVPTSTLHLTLDLPDLPPSTGPHLGVAQNSDPQSEFFLDGESNNAFDLAFVPLYQMRLIDYIWPISQMAYGRPGLFGWPPFYPIVIYLIVLSLYSVAKQVWQTTHSSSIDAS